MQQGQQQAAAAFNPYQQIGNAALGTLYQRLGMRPPATGPALPGQAPGGLQPFSPQMPTPPPMGMPAGNQFQSFQPPQGLGPQPGMPPDIQPSGFNVYGTGPR